MSLPTVNVTEVNKTIIVDALTDMENEIGGFLDEQQFSNLYETTKTVLSMGLGSSDLKSILRSEIISHDFHKARRNLDDHMKKCELDYCAELKCIGDAVERTGDILDAGVIGATPAYQAGKYCDPWEPEYIDGKGVETVIKQMATTPTKELWELSTAAMKSWTEQANDHACK